MLRYNTGVTLLPTFDWIWIPSASCLARDHSQELHSHKKPGFQSHDSLSDSPHRHFSAEWNKIEIHLKLPLGEQGPRPPSMHEGCRAAMYSTSANKMNKFRYGPLLSMSYSKLHYAFQLAIMASGLIVPSWHDQTLRGWMQVVLPWRGHSAGLVQCCAQHCLYTVAGCVDTEYCNGREACKYTVYITICNTTVETTHEPSAIIYFFSV